MYHATKVAIIFRLGASTAYTYKFIPKELREQGFAVVAVNYRLSPKAKNPAYIEDAAEAVAWVFKNIEKYGGRKDHILFPVILREVIFR